MKKWKIYEYAGCSTCRKALKFLDEHEVPYEKIDITTQPPTRAELLAVAKQAGGVRKLFNTSGLVYKEMKLSEKLPALAESDALALLAANGRLVKRPFVVGQDGGLVGFREPDWLARLAGK